MSDLPAPLVPADVDLRDFPFTPIYRARLFGSAFNARTTDSEWRAGVTLWLKSWDQSPAGSLPDDDIELARLAELGRDQKTWRKVKAGALHGWVKCSDGRLYHPVVAEGVLEAWQRKREQRWRSEVARIKKHNQRNGTTLPIPTFEEFAARGSVVLRPVDRGDDVPSDARPVSPGTRDSCPQGHSLTVHGDNDSKGQGQRYKKGRLCSSSRSSRCCARDLGTEPGG